MSVMRCLTLLSLPFFVTACGAEEAKPAPTPVEVATVQADEAAITSRFAKIGIDVLEIVPSDVAGLMEVRTEGGVLFTTPSGDHFIAGTLYALDKDGNYKDIVAERQAPLNAKKIAQYRDSMIEYKADNEKYAVTVFTDITCGYCVRLHSQIEGYNDLGITVRYLAYPREGVNGQVAENMAKIWCAEDPKTAMHDAKVNRKQPTFDGDLAQCKATIAKHYNLGRELGISGTPAIFLPNGEMVGGYLPPADLLKRLESTQQ
ncbi:thiol:disulfide interchange protein [Vibrio sp. 10N.286.49.C2]|uniref:bifunctional protein-disulfide isomerase/oxidoreductase DsbC n=1 Tax=unclassified Vibrio TaxID=2614977 RepID=UPI000C8236B5|nr:MULTISPECIES: bifunctional protein-disulfide isomerase/oxidoreductase DsbC [unclassified Vibrio]PMH27615.1 thiol:disulfide interchange protein [Vibrio sp. 10N.286.49.C2]PMH53041.1 thiol:disulfide interchange protein [Vibrio sp. 10N.286.49.B1]PMH77819.1 thiol:disulfide interchange protein [Vibrio sp. 10N.286.48.B7]